MVKQGLTIGLDFEVFRRAIEKSEATALADLYADDAEVRIVNRNSPPSSPFVLRGKEAVAEYLSDSCGNGAGHHVENEVLGEGRVAFNEAREYPDGTRILAATTLGIKDGWIVREVSVEVWDE